MKKCNCGKNSFTYLNTFNGKRIYKCNKTKFLLHDDSNTKFYENKKNPPCDFFEEVQIYHPKFTKQQQTKEKQQQTKEKQQQTKEKQQQTKEKLKTKVSYFLKDKYYSTFQEIEILCKKINIPIYNNENETIYEFTQRIIKV